MNCDWLLIVEKFKPLIVILSRGNPIIILSNKLFCLQQRIFPTAEPIWFSLTVKLLKGPGKVFNYFGGGYLNHPNKNLTPQ